MLTNDWTSIFFLIAFKYTAHQRTENDLVTAKSQLVLLGTTYIYIDQDRGETKLVLESKKIFNFEFCWENVFFTVCF